MVMKHTYLKKKIIMADLTPCYN